MPVELTALTYLAYNDKDGFADTNTITIMSPSAGLLLQEGGKVKFHGLQIGEISVDLVLQ